MTSQALWQYLVVARHQTHRGLAPQDERLFAARQLPALRAAAADLCWLLDRCQRWVNLARLLVTERIPQARLLDLSPG
jgi:hypothetical protein